MRAAYATSVGGDLLIVDEDDEGAPLITVQFHNEAKALSPGAQMKLLAAIAVDFDF